MPQSDSEELLKSLPSAATIREKLEKNLRESRLLRRLLKLAVEKEQLAEEKQEAAS